MTIPKLIHYVWVGGKPLPRRFMRNLDSWRRHNPGFDLVRWDESNIELSQPFVRRALEQRAWAKLSDLVRLVAVRDHGGIYLDTDVEVVGSLEGLRGHACFYAYQNVFPEDAPICNAVFGAVPGHPFINEVIDAFPTGHTGLINDIGTGPELISNLLLRKGLPPRSDIAVDVGGVSVLPRRVFYPYHWSENFTPACLRPDTVAVHHWDMSWHRYDSSWLRRRCVDALKASPYLFGKARTAYHLLKGAR